MPRPPVATGGPAAGGPERRSRVPAGVGALVAIAVGAGAVLWLTRGDDAGDAGDAGETERTEQTEQTERTEQTEETDGGDGTAPAGTDAAPTTAADTAGTVADTTPATTTPLVLPTTVAPPTTDASLAVVDIPPGATIHSDPSGWTIALDPAWTVSPDATAWFTGTGTPDFQDNVSVAVEVLSQAVTLDEYLVAAIGQIQTQAADFQFVDQRRVVGADGVEVEIIGWSGTFTGLPTLAFVQAVTVTPTNAYIATFTSLPDRMPALAPTIGPYLTTIRGT
ncbi:MAG: hypothetical protein ACK5CE_02485 [Actinomycetes bacterium]